MNQTQELRAETAEKRSTPKISLEHVTRRFGGFTAVDDVSLEIEEGDFLVLLGPSGCGKSTLLRMIAGLQPLTSGVIRIDGEEAQDLEPGDRDLAFVFQSYALYPHMTVRRNMSFPLVMQKLAWWQHIPIIHFFARRAVEKSPEVVERIEHIAQILGLEKLLDRHPATLSGGQRQRVALGRAMVREPLAFLMDEPLSNLDAKLRAQTRSELIEFHKLLKTTIIYVTHDQVEAMTMGGKIGVMLDGRLQQFGTPREVYENPANTFVAQFIGTPAMKLITARTNDAGLWEFADVAVEPPAALAEVARAATEADGGFQLGIRSEWVSIGSPESASIAAEVVSVEDWGSEQLVQVRLSGGEQRSTVLGETSADEHVLDVRASSRQRYRIGERVGVLLDLDSACIFDLERGEALARKGVD